ncbi:D-alanyl-D-alanine carboxypeptidase/D-alanyl-D-alanine-endopeptidase [Azospirillum sp. RWY-5-1]|uniref:D-alanyl-D-alanine carboxypeptidase/D-alanyl-D-alanine-endopeptidase n=1 Tax=Azospirillum oleiclasticum TaxID=2735135 RepID=A0ABX2T6B3_9PROT|nr:D-alanyl-D-alanine carboxypeptidase/D-alanyl-D-alanine-endopeptidase [Azospirillum oleiclasticum]NYZ11532.1 D-alanyl-D-alanine carboxypeptidase/D-alanyl-D-alanine-endopeptidase [Azospirillum oleiclasticum]NYZ18693.1 D-alanyl-D-alanine carboxypeptidase/D-alanyl-D-alanine-endopeptidase [Azospirillum oleiclasticum]
MPIRLLIVTVALVLSLSGCAATAAAPQTVEHGFPPEAVGALLFELDSGRALEQYRADFTFAPASVAKLATATAALAVLGPDHRFATALHATGPVRAGVLEGDLILHGGGDPALATEDLADLAHGLAARGVRRVAGRFLYDATALPEFPEIDSTQPWVAGYNAGIGALSVNFNRFLLAWERRPDGTTDAAAWAVSDAGRHRLDSVRVDVQAAGPRALYPEPDKTGERWRLVPALAPPARSFLPVTKPGAATAALFRRVAEESGIRLLRPAAGRLPAGATPLVVHQSPPLPELVAGLLRWSNNPTAELVGLATARWLAPSVATMAESSAMVDTRLRALAPDVDWSGFRLANHSGLSSESRVTPRQIAAVLRLGGPALWALLPPKGDDSSGPAAIHAKSGTMAYARGLAGVLRAASGRSLGFVVFVGDPAARQALDATMDRGSNAIPPAARDWLNRARALESALISDWIRHY